MSILDITEQIEKFQVQNSIGAGENIQYSYRNGETIPSVKSFVEATVQGDEKRQGVETRRMFYSVELPRRPSFGDIIVYNGKNYKVEEVIKDDTFSKLYDVITTLNKVPKGQKYGY